MTECRRAHLGVVIAVMLLCLASLTGVSPAEEQKSKGKKDPTVITSQTLTADNKARTALFEGAVAARKGEMTLFADKMLVFYSEEGSGSSIRKIEAEGSVKVIRGDRVITARNATYLTEPEERIIFTGDERASEGDNVVTGTKMTYFMKDDRSVVENSKVFIVDKGAMTGAGGTR
jgi:lipopolysaccharide export system protein LptA